MTKLKDSKYDGKGGLWPQYNGGQGPAMQGSIQIGGRVIALTIWNNKRGSPNAPEYTISVNEQKTAHDDVVWFRSLNASAYANGKAPTSTGPTPDDDIPF